MSQHAPTTNELRKAAILSDAEIDAASAAYVADRRLAPVRFGSGHTLDIEAAVRAYSPGKAAIEGVNPSISYRCSMVRTAILLARPEAP